MFRRKRIFIDKLQLKPELRIDWSTSSKTREDGWNCMAFTATVEDVWLSDGLGGARGGASSATTICIIPGMTAGRHHTNPTPLLQRLPPYLHPTRGNWIQGGQCKQRTEFPPVRVPSRIQPDNRAADFSAQ